MTRTMEGFVVDGTATRPPRADPVPREGSPTGEAGSFDALFAAHYATVHSLLCRLVGDTADDLAQETFWRLYGAPPAVYEGNVRAWLCRVALNLGYNALRSARRRAWYESLFQTWAGQIGGLDNLDPASTAERADEVAQVRCALARLKPRDAQLLILRAEGMSYRELAEVVRVSASSIGTLLRRAEQAFCRAFAVAGRDDPGR